MEILESETEEQASNSGVSTRPVTNQIAHTTTLMSLTDVLAHNGNNTLGITNEPTVALQNHTLASYRAALAPPNLRTKRVHVLTLRTVNRSPSVVSSEDL